MHALFKLFQILSHFKPILIYKGNQSLNNNGRSLAERRDSTEPTSIESTNSPFSSLTSTLGTMAQTPNTSLTASDREQNLAICAVLLDEWLKELSAISQEHYVVMISNLAGNEPIRDRKRQIMS